MTDDWNARSACGKPGDLDLFYSTNLDDQAEAKKRCTTCPVIAECLAYALANHEEEGVWGGLTAEELTRLRRRQGSGIGRGRRPWSLQPCGSEAAYRRHIRSAEIPCAACRAAHAMRVSTSDEPKSRGSSTIGQQAVRSTI